jgi:hypothetical protein
MPEEPAMTDAPAPLTKRCSKCGREKPLEQFKPHPGCRYGRSGQCRACYAAYRRAWVRRNPERVRECARRYRRKAASLGHRGRQQPFNRQDAARTIANLALRAGILPRKYRCEKCGIEARHARLYKHHADYGRPLDVVWLCGSCHGREHRKVPD